jgi:phenylacetate-CoA ligase
MVTKINEGVPEISVIVPCFNESENIPALISRIFTMFDRAPLSGEIILIDDGSTDKTASVIREKMNEFPGRVRGEFHKVNRGIEAAWQTGVWNARGKIMCLIDADLQYLPEDIIRLVREYRRTGADMVQGWRSSIGRDSGPRYYLSVVLNWLLNFLFGMKARDNKSGFVVTRKEVLLSIFNHRFKYYYFQSFITAAAHARGYTIREIETLFNKRRVGKSFLSDIPLLVIARTFVDLAKAFVEYRFAVQDELFLERFLKNHKTIDSTPEYSLLRRVYFKIYILLMPLHHWLIGASAAKYFWALRKTQWLSISDIKKLQLERLRANLDHAYRHVAYYRNLFDNVGFNPEELRSLDDLSKIPLLDKKTIKEHLYFDMLSDNHDKKNILQISTSGSTGEPFVCFADRYQLEIRWASTLRCQEWTGYKFGDKCLRLWHQTIGMKKSQILRERLDALFSRRKFIPTYEMSRNNLSKIIDLFEVYKPVLVDGYAEAFNLLARYLKYHPEHRVSIKGMMSSAQTLPQHSRDIIEEGFNTKVYDKYGAREFSGIAYECEKHLGHHVMAESYIVEILKDGKPALPGEIGEVVITDLNNYCMPFIRYRIGDLAVAVEEKCSCGRGLPLIGKIQGRTQSIIIGTKEQYVPGALFPHLLKDYEYMIQQFQVEQRKLGEVILRIVKGEQHSEETMSEINSILQQYLGPGMNINVQYVDKIPLGRTGKVQMSISHLDIDFQKVSGVNMTN